MRVLLLNAYFRPHYIRSARSTWPSISGSNWYPIFLAYCCGWLEKHGHECRLVDAQVAGISADQTLKIAKEFKPEMLVLYISADSLKSDLTIGKAIKKTTGCQLVLVGPWCATNPSQLKSDNSEVDYVIPREFDQAVLEIANGIKPTNSFLTPKQLDEMPFVTKVYQQHLPIAKYYQASLLHPFVDLFTARGCSWGKCTFCLWPHTIHKNLPYRLRSIVNVIAELKFIQKELPQVKEIFIQDDTLPAFRARQLAQAILKAGLKITWSTYARADLDLATLKLMKKAGCRFLHVGYESADEQILKNICKGVTPKTAKKFTENARQVGLRIHGDFILGLPGETEQTISKTIKWAKNLDIEGYQFFIPQVHQGTPLFTAPKAKISSEKLNYWRFRAMKEIYLSPVFVWNTLKNINSWSDLKRLLRTAKFVIPNLVRK